MEMASKRQFRTIDEYIAEFPENIRNILEEFRRVIREAAPQAKEAMRYGIPTFRLNGNLVHFAAFKNHIGFYPTPSAIKAFNKELAPYKQAKGSVQFPIGSPVPYDIVRKIVIYRVEESLETGKKEM
jgi:uncharacterized protein YdhG (YjbR/CyaY superfamily)